MKSNNQGLKETIFIQKGRRSRDGDWGREDMVWWWGGGGGSWWNGQSHIHMWWIKIRRDTWGANDPSPRPDHATQGSSVRENKAS